MLVQLPVVQDVEMLRMCAGLMDARAPQADVLGGVAEVCRVKALGCREAEEGG